MAIVLLLLVRLGDGGAGTTSRRATGVSHGAGEPAHVSRIDPPDIEEVRNARPQQGWEPHPGPVPIFRYHVVGNAPPGARHTELFVTAADFRAQMNWLEAHGYEAVGLESVEEAWYAGGTLPAKPVVLSFDGVRGRLLDLVVPELRRRGWPGDLILETRADPARAEAVARLLALGWDLEPSGSAPVAVRRFVRARFGAPARNFAFPQGESAGSEVPTLEAAGFSGATVTGGGFAAAAHPFDLPRITVFNASRVRGFAEAMRSHGEGVGA
jgi:peptidoglycan/xylan/chitin deacetylase (PgdA/CDA1 family)